MLYYARARGPLFSIGRLWRRVEAAFEDPLTSPASVLAFSRLRWFGCYWLCEVVEAAHRQFLVSRLAVGLLLRCGFVLFS